MEPGPGKDPVQDRQALPHLARKEQEPLHSAALGSADRQAGQPVDTQVEVAHLPEQYAAWRRAVPGPEEQQDGKRHGGR